MIAGALVTILVTWLCFTVAIDRNSTKPEIFLADPSEGSGSGTAVDDVTIWSNDIPPLSTDSDMLRSTPQQQKSVTKRATNIFYNGIVDRKFFSSFSYLKPTIPKTAVIPFNRPLQRGNNIPQLQYIALWAARGQGPHWGIIAEGANKKLDGVFIKDRRIYNLSSTDMQSTTVRLLQYTGNEAENNFRFAWVKAIEADFATVVSEKAFGLCNPRFAPAILQDQGYEYLGEADLDNRVMYYVEHNYINTVQGSLFTNNVYLLTKQQCQCSCPLNIY